MIEFERLQKELEQTEKQIRELTDQKARIEKKMMNILLQGEQTDVKEITLSHVEMKYILKDVRRKGFHMDGCRCGSYGVQIREEFGISFYRTCYKSGGIPANKLWHVDEAEFYERVEPDIQTHKGNTYIDGYIEEEKLPYRLNKEQEKRLLRRLKRISLVETRMNEYR